MAKAVDGLMDCFGERGNNKEEGGWLWHKLTNETCAEENFPSFTVLYTYSEGTLTLYRHLLKKFSVLTFFFSSLLPGKLIPVHYRPVVLVHHRHHSTEHHHHNRVREFQGRLSRRRAALIGGGGNATRYDF